MAKVAEESPKALPDWLNKNPIPTQPKRKSCVRTDVPVFACRMVNVFDGTGDVKIKYSREETGTTIQICQEKVQEYLDSRKCPL